MKHKVTSKLGLFMTNHSLYITIITNFFFFTPYCHIFILGAHKMIKNVDLGSNKDIKITNFMSYFCAIEKAIIKRVKLLTNIQGDSPYTFFPRNFCHLMYSKYIYTHTHASLANIHIHTFTSSLEIWHLSSSRKLPVILLEHLMGKKKILKSTVLNAILFLSQLLSSPYTGPPA